MVKILEYFYVDLVDSIESRIDDVVQIEDVVQLVEEQV
jgi:hypothetical protein